MSVAITFDQAGGASKTPTSTPRIVRLTLVAMMETAP